ncbi:MAG: RNA polymerase sigma factor [Sporolactobacillus sp.]
MQAGAKTNDLAFEQEVAPFIRQIRAKSLRLSKTYCDAEDLAQDALIKLYVVWRAAPQRRLTYAYVERIVRSTWIDAHRKRTPDIVLRTDIDVCTAGRAFSEDVFDEALSRLIHCLSPRQRVAVMLVDGLGCSIAETSRRMGQLEGTLRVALHRARRQLAECAPVTVPLSESLLTRYRRAYRSADPDQIVQLLSLSEKAAGHRTQMALCAA